MAAYKQTCEAEEGADDEGEKEDTKEAGGHEGRRRMMLMMTGRRRRRTTRRSMRRMGHQVAVSATVSIVGLSFQHAVPTMTIRS